MTTEQLNRANEIAEKGTKLRFALDGLTAGKNNTYPSIKMTFYSGSRTVELNDLLDEATKKTIRVLVIANLKAQLSDLETEFTKL